MRIYSDGDILKDGGMTAALPAGIGFETFKPMLGTPRVRRFAWDVRLTREGSRRAFNTGKHGASRDRGAASWDDYGVWIARLYDRDPLARIGPYSSRENFHAKTHGNYAPIFYECGCCGAYHPWDWDGDCRDDANRLADVPDYAIVRSAEDRAEADING